MYRDYQDLPIYLYYSSHDSSYLKWAQAFWLLQSAHPIKMIQINEIFDSNCTPFEFIKNTLGFKTVQKGLYVPVKIKPQVEIDLICDSHNQNRYSKTQNEEFIICVIDPDKEFCEQISIDGVFEDFTGPFGKAQIEEEIQFMQQKLLMRF